MQGGHDHQARHPRRRSVHLAGPAGPGAGDERGARFGGQKFQSSALRKLEALKAARKARGLDFLLEVDGGVNAGTAPFCVEAGADILVAGSAIFSAADPAAAVGALASL